MTKLYFLLFLVTPILFFTANSEIFEVPKMYFVYLLTLLISARHLVGYLQKRHPLYKSHPLTLPLTLFLLSQLIATLVSVNPTLSWFGYYSRLNGGLISNITYSLLFLIATVHFSSVQFTQLITRSTLLSSLPVVFYALAQHFGIDRNFWSQDVMARVFSTLGQPNWLATYLCIVLPFALTLNNLKSNKLVRLLSSAYPLLIFLSIIFTQSKTGLVAAAAIMVLSIIFNTSNSRILPRLIYPFIFLGLLLVTQNPLSQKLFPAPSHPQAQAPAKLNITSSGDIRLIVWQGALSLWRQYPLFGTGPETFADTYYWVRPQAHNLTSEWDFLYNKAHNEYLNYAANSGTFGLLTYLILITVSLGLFIRMRRWTLLTAYVSLLINHATGFSIVISSVYLFLLPLAAYSSVSAPSPVVKANHLAYLPLLLIIVFLLPKTILFYLADLSYSKALQLQSASQYSASYTQIGLANSLRPNFPEYLIHLSLISAQNALSTTDPALQKKYYQTAQTASDLTLKLSPSSINYWKLSAQTNYYLKSFNPEMLSLATSRLLAVTKLAPTDARLYYLIAEFFLEQKDYASSLTYYQKALTLKSNYDHASFRLAQIYILNKNFSEAKKMLELTLRLAPANTDAATLLKQIPLTEN